MPLLKKHALQAQQDGSVLVLTLLFILMLSLIGSSAVTISVMQQRMVGNQAQMLSSLAEAESQMAEGLDQLASIGTTYNTSTDPDTPIFYWAEDLSSTWSTSFTLSNKTFKVRNLTEDDMLTFGHSTSLNRLLYTDNDPSTGSQLVYFTYPVTSGNTREAPELFTGNGTLPTNAIQPAQIVTTTDTTGGISRDVSAVVYNKTALSLIPEITAAVYSKQEPQFPTSGSPSTCSPRVVHFTKSTFGPGGSGGRCSLPEGDPSGYSVVTSDPTCADCGANSCIEPAGNYLTSGPNIDVDAMVSAIQNSGALDFSSYPGCSGSTCGLGTSSPLGNQYYVIYNNGDVNPGAPINGAGILAVNGNITLEDVSSSGQWYGLIIATGNISLRRQVVYGAVIAGGKLTVKNQPSGGPTDIVEYNGCAIKYALMKLMRSNAQMETLYWQPN